MKFEVDEWTIAIGFVRTIDDLGIILDLNIDHRIIPETGHYTGEIFVDKTNLHLPTNWIAA